MKKVFIDGSAGTTGLRIYERLNERKDIELITLSDELRKDASAREDAIKGSDIAFLCLPDVAAIEAAKMAEGSSVCIIDTSTAHRTSDDWTYGFPEVNGLREKIRSSKRIANPGCHASGFISLVAPLRAAGLIKEDEQLSCFSLTGYTGGGKKMIAEYEEDKPSLYEAPRFYGLSLEHKHIPEMMKVCGISKMPVFAPIVDDFPCGMETVVYLTREQCEAGIDEVRRIYKEYYTSGLVFYKEGADESGSLSAAAYAGRDDMEISVFGNDERMVLVSRFDNLGKGASGAAIQNLNIVLGMDETKGLIF